MNAHFGSLAAIVLDIGVVIGCAKMRCDKVHLIGAVNKYTNNMCVEPFLEFTQGCALSIKFMGHK